MKTSAPSVVARLIMGLMLTAAAALAAGFGPTGSSAARFAPVCRTHAAVARIGVRGNERLIAYFKTVEGATRPHEGPCPIWTDRWLKGPISTCQLTRAGSRRHSVLSPRDDDTPLKHPILATGNNR